MLIITCKLINGRKYQHPVSIHALIQVMYQVSCCHTSPTLEVQRDLWHLHYKLVTCKFHPCWLLWLHECVVYTIHRLYKVFTICCERWISWNLKWYSELYLDEGMSVSLLFGQYVVKISKTYSPVKWGLPDLPTDDA